MAIMTRMTRDKRKFRRNNIKHLKMNVKSMIESKEHLIGLNQINSVDKNKQFLIFSKELNIYPKTKFAI